MKSENKNKIGAGKLPSFERMEQVPPLKMLLYLSMAGMGIMFFILTILFLARVEPDTTEATFRLPRLFSVSTVLLLLSGFFMQHVPVHYTHDDLPALKRNLIWSLSLGFAFTLAQVSGWYELVFAGVSFSYKAVGTFLYLLPALHLLHIAGGLAFSCYLLVKVNKAASDPIRSLIFNRDTYRLMQLQMLRSYWHFLDAVWLALYFVFLFAL